MKLLKWLFGGLLGGILGAAIWAAVAYFLRAEVGWVAWGVGGLVGIGVRIMARDHEGPQPGMVAILIAILAILAGKFAAVELAVAVIKPESEAPLTPKEMIVTIADDLVMEKQAKGQRLNWPKGKNLTNISEPADYPAGIWEEATKRWEKLGPDEQQAKLDAAQRSRVQLTEASKRARRFIGLTDSFSLWDVLWFGLATITAFRLATRFSSEEDETPDQPH